MQLVPRRSLGLLYNANYFYHSTVWVVGCCLLILNHFIPFKFVMLLSIPIFLSNKVFFATGTMVSNVLKLIFSFVYSSLVVIPDLCR